MAGRFGKPPDYPAALAQLELHQDPADRVAVWLMKAVRQKEARRGGARREMAGNLEYCLEYVVHVEGPLRMPGPMPSNMPSPAAADLTLESV